MAKIKRTKLTDYRPDPNNANDHTERGMQMLGNSLQEVGWGRSLVADRNRVLIAGNGAQEAGVDAGFEDALEIESDGTLPIIIRRTDLDFTGDDAEKARLMALYDNRVSEVNLSWNAAHLADLKAKDFKGLQRNWTEAELAYVLGEVREPAPPKERTPHLDMAQELQQRWQVQAGDVWEMGRHILICGDCHDPATIARITQKTRVDALVADPPYGIAHDTDYTRFTGGDRPSGSYASIEGDMQPFDPRPFLDYPTVILWGANNYLGALPPGAMLVWDKRSTENGTFLSDGEVAWFNHGHGVYIFDHPWHGFIRATERGNTLHPTQKPAALFAWCYSFLPAHALTIFDPFVGSGPTYEAAEQTGHQVIGVEIVPAYCAVTLQRMSDLGISPHRGATYG